MVCPALRAKAIPDCLHHDLYDFLVRMRSGYEFGLDTDCARGARRGWRRAAAAVAVDSAGVFSSPETWAGNGGVRPGSGGCARTGAYAGRMAYRRLLVAVGLLHQHSYRRLRRIDDLAICRGSSVCQGSTSRKV